MNTCKSSFRDPTWKSVLKKLNHDWANDEWISQVVEKVIFQNLANILTGEADAKLTLTCSKSTMETLEKGLKYIQS